jgi:fatty-acid desaturase
LFGENRHNRHHADPTSARHGVDRGRLDPSVAVIRLLERLGWVHDSVDLVRPASTLAAPGISHSSMYGSWQEIT